MLRSSALHTHHVQLPASSSTQHQHRQSMNSMQRKAIPAIRSLPELSISSTRQFTYSNPIPGPCTGLKPLIPSSPFLSPSHSVTSSAHGLRAFTSTAYRAAPPDPPSLVKSFLYGSEKGQELQRQMEQSYSKVLARGKYVHKINEHHVRPDKVNEYIALM
jgi:hypothetical protein